MVAFWTFIHDLFEVAYSHSNWVDCSTQVLYLIFLIRNILKPFESFWNLDSNFRTPISLVSSRSLRALANECHDLKVCKRFTNPRVEPDRSLRYPKRDTDANKSQFCTHHVPCLSWIAHLAGDPRHSWVALGTKFVI